ncbi:MAG: cytochrome c-type biogenesis protein [Pseudomonadota bacterium]
MATPGHLRGLQALILSALMVCAALYGTSARSATAVPSAADPVLEARVMIIAEELRCLVCQNETIAASHAPLALDLRQQIREQLQQGRSTAQILEFMASRYGDFVLYKPPLKASTVLLWAGPFALLMLGAIMLLMHVRRQRPTAGPVLSESELDSARRMLDPSGGRP